jgi:hypothetical protein
VPVNVLEVVAQTGASERLLRLAAGGPVELALAFPPYQLVYRLVRRGDDRLEPRFAFPAIVEGYAVHRRARVCPPPGQLGLIDAGGRLRRPEVANISSSGVGVRATCRRRLAVGERLGPLWLQLPCGRTLCLQARVARAAKEESEWLLGLEYEPLADHQEAVLLRYIWEQHPCFGEALASELPADGEQAQA